MQCVTCICYKIEKAVLDAGSNKKLILVVNKIGEIEILCAESVHSNVYHRPCTQRSCGEMVEAS